MLSDKLLKRLKELGYPQIKWGGVSALTIPTVDELTKECLKISTEQDVHIEHHANIGWGASTCYSEDNNTWSDWSHGETMLEALAKLWVVLTLKKLNIKIHKKRSMGDGPCADCGTEDNIVWFTDNTFWNDVMNKTPMFEQHKFESDETAKILCIDCFVKRAEDKYNIKGGWRVLPEFNWERNE